MEERCAYERPVLRYMLTVRTRDGLSVVWAATLLRGAASQAKSVEP
jgi:hypothetical protein